MFLNWYFVVFVRIAIASASQAEDGWVGSQGTAPRKFATTVFG